MSSQEYKRTILSKMKDSLKPLGFRKKQAVFSKEHSDAILFIQLQSSLKTTRDLLVVTVNLGVFIPIIAEKIGNTHQPNILEAHWRQRIGHLHYGRDKWWEVGDEHQANICGMEISNVLLNKALPEMQRLASIGAIKALFQSGTSPGLTDYERNQYLRVLELE